MSIASFPGYRPAFRRLQYGPLYRTASDEKLGVGLGTRLGEHVFVYTCVSVCVCAGQAKHKSNAFLTRLVHNTFYPMHVPMTTYRTRLKCCLHRRTVYMYPLRVKPLHTGGPHPLSHIPSPPNSSPTHLGLNTSLEDPKVCKGGLLRLRLDSCTRLE